MQMDLQGIEEYLARDLYGIRHQHLGHLGQIRRYIKSIVRELSMCLLFMLSAL
jgi:hypothetical protein